MEKPVEGNVVAVVEALEKDRQNREQVSQAAEDTGLTAREFEVFRYGICGSLNKQIAWALDISLNTFKANRACVLNKMDVQSVAEPVRLAAKTGVQPVASITFRVQ